MKRQEKIMKTRIFWIPAAAAAFFFCWALVQPGSTSFSREKEAFVIKSPVFEKGEEIPARYTCIGEDISPPLRWKGVPENTRSLALVVYDPDAPDPENPKTTWIHWVLFNMPPDAGGLPEDAEEEGLPPGTEKGLNSWEKTGYGGPCPPIGRHRYFHKLYALDTVLKDLRRPCISELEKAMKGRIIEETHLVGTFEK